MDVVTQETGVRSFLAGHNLKYQEKAHDSMLTDLFVEFPNIAPNFEVCRLQGFLGAICSVDTLSNQDRKTDLGVPCASEAHEVW